MRTSTLTASRRGEQTEIKRRSDGRNGSSRPNTERFGFPLGAGLPQTACPPQSAATRVTFGSLTGVPDRPRVRVERLMRPNSEVT